MKTERLIPTKENIKTAGEMLRNGKIVAFPTETVYGLGANALDEKAVHAVYDAKGRPGDNPMIVHISDTSQIRHLVSDTPQNALILIAAFWPGPLTLVFNRSEIVPDVTTGGLDTVAVRMPSNETARALIKAAGRPIAAPSANISGRPSPTTAEDVLEDMDGRIDAVIMGEACTHGIESTVVDVTGKVPMILRPGAITKSMIENVLNSVISYDPTLLRGKDGDGNFRPKSPGMKYRHYAPKAKVRIISGPEAKSLSMINELRREAKQRGVKTAILNYGDDSRRAAKDFFSDLRACDRDDIEIIYVYANAADDLGFSVMNRMLKSAGYDITVVEQ